MPISKAEAESILTGSGFKMVHSWGLGESYSLPLPTKMTITASAGFVSKGFFEPADRENYRDVHFTLNDSTGTLHKCLSVAALRDNLQKIIAELSRVSKEPDLLKCPKCGIRNVHAKEPPPGAKWKPFLSCNGMMIVGKGNDKHPACDGVSHRLPAVVTYE